ncbi:hypothetical protein Thal_0081 [Thermocrinis albus DSM 14484]|uniref:Uncharacterized protein n=1 Tax=Thermocrinis albus (strain DSM 14484 / JCM 11386 / HI 11/12) TaxID=638303 RepID=D3SNI1_THEAH|nr:hypothetical protein Thal_0081 [Thermocrinis albus DSM 14484]
MDVVVYLVGLAGFTGLIMGILWWYGRFMGGKRT